MYEDFFGLTEKPFSIQPDPSFLYWGRGHRLAYAMLEYGVVNQAGISVVTGEVGCGKTTLVHRLLDQLSDTHSIALLSNIQAGRGDLLSWVLMGYGEPYAGKTHVEMFAQLQQFFIREYSKGKRVVLIIDEAQNLSTDMLEELRMLSNINAGKDQLLQLILVGQPQLKDILSRPEMLQLAQRIGSDFHLTPLTRDEVHAYVDTRLSIAGARRKIFMPEAIDLIAEYSRGVPRVINTIADTALVYAFSAHEETISADMVSGVIRDKLDYGVFGIASSPALKLAERDDRRPSTAFIGDDERAPPAPRMSVRQTFTPPEPPRAEPSLREAPVAPKRRQKESHRHDAQGADAPAPREAAVAAKADTPMEETGAVIICADEALEVTAHSVPPGATIVVVAAAGSPAAAAGKQLGLDVIEVDAAGCSGGRARNAGYRRLKKVTPNLKFVQFVRSGVELDPNWFSVAARFMARRPEVAVVEGRLASGRSANGDAFFKPERRRAADDGELQATGPDAFFRAEAFEAAGGFRGDIIADETADLCIRLRRRGAHAWRSEEPMAILPPEDASFSAWRMRAIDDGYGYAAGAALHGGSPEKYRTKEQSRAVWWGAAFPAIIGASAVAGGAAAYIAAHDLNPVIFGLSIVAAGMMIYGLKIAVSAIARGFFRPSSWSGAIASTIRHFYEFAGVSRYWFGSRKNQKPRRANA